ncbi:hypothetical protein E3N88_22984 [Mikania micrantha]|uniref:Uncharacterized protein n=1 Tax=Mikania micrantha TaxID=192012 RepID=A0A5N6NDF6_9ASTR|nr:hypothetical protein E3N88_22984 [Mikania micrantha]
MTFKESLDLSFKGLTCNVPSELIKLNSLEVFNVSFNNLSGRLPEIKAQFGTFTKESYEGNPLLCGLPLEKEFTMESHGTQPSNEEGTDEKWNDMDMTSFYGSCSSTWFVLMLGFAVVLYVNHYLRRLWFHLVDESMYTCFYFIYDLVRKTKYHLPPVISHPPPATASPRLLTDASSLASFTIIPVNRLHKTLAKPSLKPYTKPPPIRSVLRYNSKPKLAITTPRVVVITSGFSVNYTVVEVLNGDCRLDQALITRIPSIGRVQLLMILLRMSDGCKLVTANAVSVVCNQKNTTNGGTIDVADEIIKTTIISEHVECEEIGEWGNKALNMWGRGDLKKGIIISFFVTASKAGSGEK